MEKIISHSQMQFHYCEYQNADQKYCFQSVGDGICRCEGQTVAKFFEESQVIRGFQT